MCVINVWIIHQVIHFVLNCQQSTLFSSRPTSVHAVFHYKLVLQMCMVTNVHGYLKREVYVVMIRLVCHKCLCQLLSKDLMFVISACS